MNNATAQARKLATLLQQIHRQIQLPVIDPVEPVTQVVMAFLQWNNTRKAANAAYGRLMAVLVDTNDLRVSHPDELVRILGERYPQVEERAHRLHDVLQEIYVRAHGMSLESLTRMGRKELRHYLDSLPGITPYVAASVALLSFDCHAIPVDDTLAGLLRERGIADAQAAPEQIASFLEHHVKAGEARATHLLLQAWADSSPGKSGGRSAQAVSSGDSARTSRKKSGHPRAPRKSRA